MSEEIVSMVGDSQLLVVGVLEAVSARLIYCGFYIGTAASSSFHSILMELRRMNRVDIVIIAEPRVKEGCFCSEAINNGGKQQDQGSNNTMVDGFAAEISYYKHGPGGGWGVECSNVPAFYHIASNNWHSLSICTLLLTCSMQKG
ncbi:hypothetical protein Peur_036490 [Populus x canadensis]